LPKAKYKFEKSISQISQPITGITKSSTIEVTILPKAAPIITATAKSITFHLTANSLNSLNIFIKLLV